MKPHKHAVEWAEDLIKQLPENHDERNSWLLNYGSKPDFYKSYLVFTNRIYSEGEMFPLRGWSKPNLQLTFDGETGELKSAEVLK